MPTQQQVINTILASQLKVANLVNDNLTTLSNGGLSVQWGYINYTQRAINAVSRQYNLQDYSSTGIILAYDTLLNLTGTYGIGILNPNAQIPGTTILINSIKVSKTQANLIDAGGGNWYLPYLDNSNQTIPSAYVPEYISINGVTLNGWTLNDSTVPPRVYGFANNDAPQDIELTLI